MPQQVVHSTCALDCPDACSILVTVEDGRATRLRGNPDHPVTRGFLCAKVAKYLDRQYSPDRLLYPQKRTGAKGEGKFTRISWDEALDTIASRLTQIARDHGAESILPFSYAGTMGLLQGSSMDRRFFHALGASRLDRTICSSAGMAGTIQTMGSRFGTEPEQFPESKLIIAWGANILGTNVHLWPFIVEARRRGARFYTIDPYRNRTGQLSDRHFSIQPGTDLALALGMIHILIAENLYDRDYVAAHTVNFDALRQRAADFTPAHAAQLTGLSVDEIVTLAREYATVRPAAIRLNYGVQRSERGGGAISAISMLPALTGSWREVGGGLQLSTSMAFQLNRAALERADLQPKPTRLVNMTTLGQALTELNEPPVKALFVYNSNPAAILPDQNRVHGGLRRDDLFCVVAEQFQTDTADFADILLPATTFLEHSDLYFAYGHYYLQMARPAVAPPGECRSNADLFRALARRMGLTSPAFLDSDDDLIDQALASGHPFLEGITRSRLEAEHSARLNVSAAGTPYLPYAEGGFATPSGKCELNPQHVDYQPPVESRFGDPHLRRRYPLELISPKNDDSMNSTFGNRDDRDGETATLYLHPDDAAVREVAEGDLVRLYNARGSVRLRAAITSSVRSGVVCSPSSRWPKRSVDRRNINALASDRLTDIGGGPTFYSCLVQVERCGD
ncbi:MAG: molybdopterin-dependent oxidoreductase [Bryobacterales bacterium]|nr:molybdopterin-dependent oxidoreductase [Bryobacterales bacterium]